MRYLRQSTSVDIPIGPFLDETDGKTAETALTITQADVRLKKNGGAWAQKNAAQTLSHEENGWYEVTLDATDTDTLGQLMLAVHESGALPVWHEFMVLPQAVYDALVSGTGDGIRANPWDGVVTSHNSAGTFGEYLQRGFVHRGTAQGGDVGYIKLQQAGTSSVAGTYDGYAVFIVGGTGAGQVRFINLYTGGSQRIANVFRTFATPPDATSQYLLVGVPGVNVEGWGDFTDSIPSTVSDGVISQVVQDVFQQDVETGYTLRQTLRIMLAALAGKVSGAETAAVTFRDVNDTTDRIVATVDGSGNRAAVTLDPD